MSQFKMFRARRFQQYLCTLLATLMAVGPLQYSLAQPAPRPRVPIQPVEDPNKTTRDTALLADPPLAPVKFELSYVLPQSCVVIAMRPAQVLKSPMLEMLPTEVLQAASIKETGVDPMTAEQVVFAMEPPIGGPPNYTVFARFSEAAKLENEAFMRHTQPAQLAGKQYHQSQEPTAPSIYQHDAKTMLLAPEPLIQDLVSGDGPGEGGELRTKFAAATEGDDLFVMFDMATLQPFIQMGLAQARDIPPEMQPLTQIPELLSLAELRVNITGHGRTELVFTANDEDAAKEILAIVDGIKEQAFAQAADATQAMLLSDDPVEQAMGRYQQRLQTTWNEQLRLNREGDRVVVFRLDPADEGQNSQLVYIATAGILVALLLPAVQAAREAARRNTSMNNLKQIMLALHNYHDTHREFPAHASYDDNGKPLLSWRVQILPYLEQQALYEQFHLDEPWDSEHNKTLIARMPELFIDPSSHLAPADGKTHYVGILGENFLFDGSEDGRGLRNITDGSSNTIAVLQVNDEEAATWTKPADWQYDAENPLRGLSGLHPGGCNAAFCDGHVRFISDMIDAETFKALLTVDGGEVVNNF